MYYYLTRALKRKIIGELKLCFRHHFPEHKDILPFIRHKYSFESRPQKGVVITNVSSDPQRLSADNFVGLVESHVMLANLEDFNGLSIEWVREDQRAVERSGIEFPSPAGVYYVEILSKESLENILTTQEFDTVLDDEGDNPFYFFVDPLLKSNREPLTKVEDPETIPDPQYILHIPALENTIRVFANDIELISGHHLSLTADKSLSIDYDNIDLGLPQGQIKVSTVSGEQEPFEILTGINDQLVVEINGQEVIITLTPGSVRTAGEVAADIRNALYADPDVSLSDFHVEALDGGTILLEATTSLAFGDLFTSTANTLLGFSEGNVPVTVEGRIFHPYLPDNGTLTLIVDGQNFEIQFWKGKLDFDDVIERIETGTNNLVDVDITPSGDYTFDVSTGRVDFFRTFDKGTRITATYKYPQDSLGPFGIKREHSNNQAIPGVVMAFGRRIEDGDKLAIVVHENRLPVAKEYGGRWEVGVDLDILTRDPATRDELAEIIQLYFFGMRKEYLTDEGLELTGISFGGDSEEVYDDTAQDYYYNASMTLTFHTDWAIHVPMPLTIERVVQTSFEEEAKRAGTEESPEVDLFLPTDSGMVRLKDIRNLYLKGKAQNYVKVK